MKWLAIALITATFCGTASGEATTQPSAPKAAWAQTVTDFASNLTNSDVGLVEPALAQSASIRTFDADAAKTLRELLSFAAESSVLGVHAYLKMPSELAADMAEDFKNIADLDEKIREEMIPNEGAMTRANATASQWLMKTLSPSKNQPIAVIVLRPTKAAASADAQAPAALFVLIKGEAAGKGFHIKQVVYGDPLAPAR